MTVFILSPDLGGRVFGLDLQTAIQIGIMLFNASVLAAVLSKILYKPVQNFLKKRAEGIATQLEKAKSDMAEASELKARYETNLKDIEQERVSILETARKVAAEQTKETLIDAKKEADAIRARASIDIKNEQEQAREVLRLHIIEVASAMAEKVVTHTVDKETQDRLFNETLKELEEAAWPN
jgi:F-type H+-transporting ATPase subunit b